MMSPSFPVIRTLAEDLRMGWSVWIHEAPGQVVDRWKDALFKGQISPNDLDNETMRRAFYQIGRHAVLMWLFGYNDLHGGSCLIPPHTPGSSSLLECVPIDFETIGQAAIFDKEAQTPVGFQIWKGLMATFVARVDHDHTKLCLYPWPRTLLEALVEGVSTYIDECCRNPSFLEPALAVFEQHTGPLYTRIVIQPTLNYLAANGWNSLVPHYTMPITGPTVANFVRSRLAQLAAVHSQEPIVLDPAAPGFPTLRSGHTRYQFLLQGKHEKGRGQLAYLDASPLEDTPIS